MIKLGNAVFALREDPFLTFRRTPVGDSGKFGRNFKPMITQRNRHLRKRVDAATIIALAPDETGNAGEFQRTGGTQRVLIGTALSTGQDSVMSRAGDDGHETDDGRAGTFADIGVRCQREERRQALEIDGEIGGGVELGHFPLLEMIEPSADALEANGRLFGTQPTRAGKRFSGCRAPAR